MNRSTHTSRSAPSDLATTTPTTPTTPPTTADPISSTTPEPPPGHATNTATTVAPKPRLRGVLHAATVPLLAAGIIVLIAVAPGAGPKTSLAIYLACAMMLFGNSATYHIGNWSPTVKAVLRRIDHSNIYLFVAGTYTPLAVILLSGTSQIVLLSLIWGLALAGVLFRTLWLSAPRRLYTAMYVVMGWTALWWLPQFARAGGVAIVVLIIVGGVIYSLGAGVYSRKWPDPCPKWFGFHEVFHSCTVLAAACHWTAVLLAVRHIM